MTKTSQERIKDQVLPFSGGGMEWAGVQWSQVRDSDAQMETMPHRLNKARGTDRVEVK